MAWIIPALVGIIVGAVAAALWLKKQSSAKLHALQLKHQKATSKLEADHQQRLKDNSSSLKRDYDRRIQTVTDELKQQHQADLDQLKSDYESRLEAATQGLKQAHQDEIAVITENLKANPVAPPLEQTLSEESMPEQAWHPEMSAPVADVETEATDFNPFAAPAPSSEARTDAPIAAATTAAALSAISLGVAAKVMEDEAEATDASAETSAMAMDSQTFLLDTISPAAAAPAAAPAAASMDEEDPSLENLFGDSFTDNAPASPDASLVAPVEAEVSSSPALVTDDTASWAVASMAPTEELEDLEDLDFDIDVTEFSALDAEPQASTDTAALTSDPDSLDGLALDDDLIPNASPEQPQAVAAESAADLSWEEFLNDPAETTQLSDSGTTDALMAEMGMEEMHQAELDEMFASLADSDSEALVEDFDLDALLDSAADENLSAAPAMQQSLTSPTHEELAPAAELPADPDLSVMESSGDLDAMLDEISVSAPDLEDDLESLFGDDAFGGATFGAEEAKLDQSPSPSLDEILAMGAGAVGVAGVATLVSNQAPNDQAPNDQAPSDEAPDLDMLLEETAPSSDESSAMAVAEEIAVPAAATATLPARPAADLQSLPSVLELRQLADHTDPDVRQEVAQRLGAISHRRKLRAELKPMIPVLGRLSQDHSPQVRTQAVHALGRVQSMQVLPFLRRALQDRSPEVIQAAAIAIRQVKPVTTKAVKSAVKPGTKRQVKRQAVGA